MLYLLRDPYVTLAGPYAGPTPYLRRTLRLTYALPMPYQVAAQLGHAEIVALFEQEEEQRDAAWG